MAEQQYIPGTAPQEKVEQMTFDLPCPQPIKGFPELRWAGKRPFTSTHYFPAQLKERYGDPVDGWMNRIYWGDNLQVMSHLLKEFRGKVDLVYIDPPFDSKADYKKIIELNGERADSDSTCFEEKQYTDIWSNDEYLQFIYERIVLVRELLSDTGALYLHCDPRKASYLRIILDEIFGKDNFRNEVIWHYKFRMMDSEKQYNKKHDNIYFYAKSSKTKIVMPKEEWTKEELITTRKQEIIIDDSGTEMIWMPGQKGNSKSRMVPLGEILARGKAVDDVWDMPIISSSAHERTAYPTQKPEVLIERIIKSSCPTNGLVFDCFMGSGTTQAVAMKLGRRFIGADINLGAIQTTTKRLNGIIAEKKQEPKSLLDQDKPLYLNFEVYNVNNYDVFRNPVQARELLIQALEIEPLESTDVFDGMKDGFKVKIMPVNRIASRADLNPIISGINYRELDRSIERSPGKPAERIMLVCMGHEPDLAAHLKMEIGMQYRVEVEVVDILREKERGLTFKYDSEAEIAVEGNELVIQQFYPRNLLQKLSILDENVEEWRELVETVAIDWNYNGEVLQPAVYDSPGKKELVRGRYPIPGDHGIIRVKITDLLSESLEMTVEVE